MQVSKHISSQCFNSNYSVCVEYATLVRDHIRICILFNVHHHATQA